MDHAACAGMRPAGGEDDIFFPSQGKAKLLDRGREVCDSCPVFKQCDDYRIANNERFGLWAGKFYDGGRTPKPRPE